MNQQTPAQVREHYEIEREIADRLRNSSAAERKTLYTWAYDELLRRVPHHPCLTIKLSKEERENRVKKEFFYLETFLNADTVFLEIGPGDCAVSLKAAERVKKVYAIDVSEEITKGLDLPANFQLILSDGTSVSAPPETVDVAYSNQLMEHLHPEDSRKQLENLFAALKTGGIYFCSTPNRLSGPHDVSRNFDSTATGLHLKEFTVAELEALFREVGFSKSRVYFRFGKFNLFLPPLPFKLVEKIVGVLPESFRKLVTFNRVVRFLLGIRLIGTK